MGEGRETVLHIPATVREDVGEYRANVEKFLAGETKDVVFRAYRVPMGIYEQRTTGEFMVRIRIAAGLVLPGQLKRIAELSRQYGNGVVHVTTRQDIQIHDVDIADTPDILESLLEVGLSARGGGGNTVRNVTACPRAGVCPNEAFDVTPHSIAAAEYLLQDRSSFNLPRKYKIVFSGCSEDCAFASVADLGFFAHVRDGVKGFAVYAAGGLGGSPNTAIKLEDFVGEGEIFEIAEAIKRLFDKHGDRSNKHKARLRFVLKRVGEDEFVRLYREQREILRAQGLEGDVPEIRESVLSLTEGEDRVEDGERGAPGANVFTEKAPGLSTIKLCLKLGDVGADDLARIADIAEEFGSGYVRTTQQQNLLVLSVPDEKVEGAIGELKKLDTSVLDNNSGRIVACAGASTCKLGLCLSRGLADAIDAGLDGNGAEGNGTMLRISGCPNSCGHHYLGDIGFQGRAKRIDGRLMPCYDVLAGAKIHEGDTSLGSTIGTLPAKRIPEFVAEVFKTNALEGDAIKKLVEKYGDFTGEFSDDFFYDYDSEKPFSLEGRGPGECGAGVMDIMKVDIDEAKQAIEAESPGSEGLYKSIVASCRSLLVVFGLEPKKDREIFAAFGERLIDAGWVKADTKKLLEDAVDWRMGDKESLEDSTGAVKELVERIEALCLSLDAGLKFTAEPVDEGKHDGGEDARIHVADLRGVGCPLNFVKAKLRLEKIAVGEVLEVLLDEGEPVRNVPASFTEQGQEILGVDNVEGYYSVKVLRKS